VSHLRVLVFRFSVQLRVESMPRLIGTSKKTFVIFWFAKCTNAAQENPAPQYKNRGSLRKEGSHGTTESHTTGSSARGGGEGHCAATQSSEKSQSPKEPVPRLYRRRYRDSPVSELDIPDIRICRIRLSPRISAQSNLFVRPARSQATSFLSFRWS
jgi:hypothetical protein